MAQPWLSHEVLLYFLTALHKLNSDWFDPQAAALGEHGLGVLRCPAPPA